MERKGELFNFDREGFDLIQYKLECLAVTEPNDLNASNSNDNDEKLSGSKIRESFSDFFHSNMTSDPFPLARSISQESVEYHLELDQSNHNSKSATQSDNDESVGSHLLTSSFSHLVYDIFSEFNIEELSQSRNSTQSSRISEQEAANIKISPIGESFVKNQRLFCRGSLKKDILDNLTNSQKIYYKSYDSNATDQCNEDKFKNVQKTLAYIINFDNEYDLSIAIKYNIWSIKYQASQILQKAYEQAKFNNETILLMFFNKTSRQFQAIGQMESPVYLDSDFIKYSKNLSKVKDNCWGFRSNGRNHIPDDSAEFLTSIMYEDELDKLVQKVLQYETSHEQRCFEEEYVNLCGLTNPARLMTRFRMISWFRVGFTSIKNVDCGILDNVFGNLSIKNFDQTSLFCIENKEWISYIYMLLKYYPTDDTIESKRKIHKEMEYKQIMTLDRKGIF